MARAAANNRGGRGRHRRRSSAGPRQWRRGSRASRMTPHGAQARETVALAATLACVLEASADKVGNVTPTRAFADMRFTHFVDSAAVLGPAIAQARPGQVGRAIWKAVAAARRVVPTNTHLGVALLLAPLAAAWMVGPRGRLRSQVARVLAR